MSLFPETRTAGRPRSALLSLLLALALLASGAGLAACTVEAENGESSGAADGAGGTDELAGDPDEVLIRIGDEEITRAQVEEHASEEVERIETQLAQCRMQARQSLHEVLERQSRQLVRERLLAEEAEEREMSQDQLLQAEVQSRAAEITDAEVDAFYEENQNRIPRPKEEVTEQIRQYLRQQRESEAYEEFISGLEEQARVAYQIGPYRAEVDVEGEPSTGPADAPVTIVEFSDFECPFCSRVVPTLERIKEEYGDRVRLVFKQFPLAMHANAQKAAEASLCAHDQNEFWAMHDAMFENQDDLGMEGLEGMAESLGLDMASFRECLRYGKYEAAVKQDMAEGSAVGVSGTPAMFINGRMVSGAVPYEAIASVVDDELEASGP